MHRAVTEVKKLSKFGMKGHTKRSFAKKIGTMPQYQKWYKALRRADAMQSTEIGRDPASL
jgi:hypothetical protein